MKRYVDQIIADKDFGHLYIRTNARAVRYTFHPANDGTPECGLLVTVPTGYKVAELLQVVEKNRPQLRAMLQQQQTTSDDNGQTLLHHIDWDFCIRTDCLHVLLVRGTGEGFSLHHQWAELRKDAEPCHEVVRPAVLQVVCPPDCDFDAPGRQQWLERVIEEGIRTHAKLQLLPRLQALARQHGVKLHEVKVNNSKSHWGSCGSHHRDRAGQRVETYYNINLSLLTLLLPLPVQRLILLHELMHTRHMDHSEAFHRDLDGWLQGQEKTLEQELKRYHTNIYAFVTSPLPPAP